MLDAYSLEEGVVSPITPLTTFSDDSQATEEFVSIDDLRPFFVGETELLQLLIEFHTNILFTKL
jgi:hypothetical protein